eukprot:1388520-Karenia_brevis.AAC.1
MLDATLQTLQMSGEGGHAQHARRALRVMEEFLHHRPGQLPIPRNAKDLWEVHKELVKLVRGFRNGLKKRNAGLIQRLAAHLQTIALQAEALEEKESEGEKRLKQVDFLQWIDKALEKGAGQAH